MNLDEIRKRMDRLNNKSAGTKSTSDYKSTFWKPEEGEKSIVRVVPYQHNKDVPFTELYFYFGIDKPRMIALSNFDEQDPILEFATQLRKSGDADNKTLAKKLYPKMRVFAPVIVRGEEDKGVRFWEFGKQVYQELLGVMMDEDYGDITDVVKGRDITVEVIPAKETGKMYPTTTIRVKPKQTPLSDDAEQVEKFLNTQVNIKEFFTKYSFDEMKEALQKYLAVDEDVTEEKEDIQYTKSNAKKTVDDKIDELFD
jgi:hypothetical protein